MIHVAIAVATYRRPELLRGCLAGVAALDSDSVRVTTIVIDNDAAGSARAVVQAAGLPPRAGCVYEIEPERNISRARNRAVAIALRLEADFVAFLDDDEVPERDWLQELLRAQRDFDADVAWGPAIPIYPANAPRWIIDGNFFDANPNAPRGTRFHYAYTSNALVSARTLQSVEGPFDPAFGLGGGGDTDFFLRAHKAGARIVWTPDARVRDVIHASRLNARWILQRAFRAGNAGAHMNAGRARIAAVACAQLAAGTLLFVPSLVRGRAGAVHALRRIAGGAGALAGLAGHRYIEYAETHGR